MKLAAELEASLREFVSAGAAEFCDNGGHLAPLSNLSWEVRGSDDKPLLHHMHTWLVPCRESEALLAQAREQIETIVASDPQAIAVHPSTASREVILRYRGLAFARWDDGTIFFGCNDMREELTPASRAAFERMMQDLGIYGIRWPPTRVILYLARRRNAGSSLWCATTSLAWIAFWILALFMLEYLWAAVRSTASLMCSPSHGRAALPFLN
jgi:hypothetical protein